MTREETIATYKACMIILTRKEGATMRDTEYHGDLGQYASNTKHNLNMVSAIFKIHKLLDLNSFDTTTIKESTEMPDEKAVLIISAMDNVTAVKAYIAMMGACNALGAPTSKQIEWFNAFGELHGLTYDALKESILKMR